jgi:hypothetical protein
VFYDVGFTLLKNKFSFELEPIAYSVQQNFLSVSKINDFLKKLCTFVPQNKQMKRKRTNKVLFRLKIR